MCDTRITAFLLSLAMLLMSGCGGGQVNTPEASAADSTFVQPISSPAPTGVDAQLWRQLNGELERVLAALGSEHAACAAPEDERSQVMDLAVTPGGVGAVFTFGYRCTGDYDQNGEVNVSDLTPVGVHFGKTSVAADWTAARVADGDGNGEVNAADITPIGFNYKRSVNGYQLETADAPSGGADWQVLVDVPLGDSTVPGGGGFRRFSYELAAPASQMYYRVVPYEQGATRSTGIPSEPVYYASDMLAAPQNLQASDGTYSDHVAVTWTKVAGATSYLVYRDNQDAPLATLGDSAQYDDTAPVDTSAHTYWVRAGDGARLSNFSAPDSGYLGSQGPGELEPPANLHASDGDFEDHIYVVWQKSANATGYKVFRDSQGLPVAELADVAFFNDYQVTDVFQHTYWVSAFNAVDASGLSASDTGYRAAPATNTMVVLAWNDLGMHCMNQDFSELTILPPYNVLHAQVIGRSGGSPEIVTENVTVRYTIPENTTSADKCNFWDYAQQLFGVALAPNVGLTGNGLAGVMTPLIATEGRNDWNATGIPITPINDAGIEDPYNLATVTVEWGGNVLARTQAVVPVSWEISCDLCHFTPGKSVALDILEKHDAMHGTQLVDARPVLCGSCHAQAPLGTTGEPGLNSLSSVMHTAHAPRMALAGLSVDCYACHPGVRTQCLRDVMFAAGESCHDCHGTMADVGNPLRSPWVTEPRCDDCHDRSGFEFEQPGVLYRNSIGHNGVHCAACHGSPHAITPTVVADDNVQAIKLQGHSGTIDKCSVCHTETPGDPFNHTRGEVEGG